MNSANNDYHISFFKPTTPQATANRNMVVWLVLIWAVAIFGFHILLRVMEKPTPQPAYIIFEAVWDDVRNENATSIELQDFAKSLLGVLGKVAIEPAERAVLDNALSYTVHQLYADSLKAGVVAHVKEFEKLKSGVSDLANPEYTLAKKALSAEISEKLNLPIMSVESKILPLELISEGMQSLPDDAKAALPIIMQKYLIHNQSILTNFKFLGFPFHYFYTAIFLLVLFIVLCWLYCVKTDKLNLKFNIAD